MNRLIGKTVSFFDNLESCSLGTEIFICEREEIDRFFTGETKLFDKVFNLNKKLIYDKLSYELDEEYFYLLVIGSKDFRWFRPEALSQEGHLSGGFFINGLFDMFLRPAEFWISSLENFTNLQLENLIDVPIGYSWFESPSSHNSSLYTPNYGCFRIQPLELPIIPHFYDCGFLYQLPFSSMEEYLSAMLDSAAVTCWQYFYVSPEEIVKRNKGVCYLTSQFHAASSLHENIRGLKLDLSITFDRLDLIHEHLERCIRLLPNSFPFLDFSHHRKHFKRFTELYNISKKS